MKSGVQQLTRRTAVIFWVMTILFVAQMGWWIVYQVNRNSEDIQLKESVLELQRLGALIRWQQYARHWTDSLQAAWADSPHNALRSSHISRLVGWSEIVFDGDDGRSLMARKRPGATLPIGRLDILVRDGIVSVFVDTSVVTGLLNREFPDVLYHSRPDTVRPVVEAVPATSLSIKAAAHERIRNQQKRRLRMLVGEGSFFILLILVGAFTIHRALRGSREFERRQQNFLAAVTHELKAPLASIRLFAETLTTRELTDEKRRDCLQRITEDVERLEELIDDTLEAGVYARRSHHAHLAPTDLSADLASYIEMYRPRAEREGLALVADIPAGVRARTDHRQLRRAVGAVIENAIKYSKAGDSAGDISVVMTTTGGHAVITITDQGTGLSPQDQKRVFERFYRAGDEMTREVSGSGLGLYLAREIITAHRGEILLSSPGPGRGTSVVIKLPLLTDDSHSGMA